MHILKNNNILAFQGSRELFIRDAIENTKRLNKPIQETFLQSELRAATYELMQDLNGMTYPKITEILRNQASKMYQTTSEKLNSQKIERLFQ